MRRAFIAAVGRIRDQVNLGRLRAALAGGDVKKVQDIAGAGRVRSVLSNDEAFMRSFQRTVTASGVAGADVLSGVVGVEVQFNARDPRVVQFAREQSSEMVRHISEGAREAVRVMIAAGADLGITTVQQARAIREAVGLPPNWATAPMNLRNEILSGQAGNATARRLSATDKAQIRSRISNETVTEEFANEMAVKYEKSLINRRAQNIARTETLRAAHAGQHIGWKQAIEDKVLPSTTRRIWIITPDERLSEEHEQIPALNPDGRGMEEPFLTLGPQGAFDYPPIRTNCRCGVGLVFPETLESGEQAGDLGFAS